MKLKLNMADLGDEFVAPVNNSYFYNKRGATQITYTKAYLKYLLMQKIQIDLPFFMTNLMAKAIEYTLSNGVSKSITLLYSTTFLA